MSKNNLEVKRRRLDHIDMRIIELKTEIGRIEAGKERLNNELIQLHYKKGRLEQLLMEPIK